VRGLITETAHVFCEEIGIHSIRQAKESYLNKGLRHKLQKYHGTNTDCAFLGWNNAWLDPAFRQWNIEEYLPGITVPMHVIQFKSLLFLTQSAHFDILAFTLSAEKN
jgi:hypothetical protein